jgi:hypothetical protein
LKTAAGSAASVILSNFKSASRVGRSTRQFWSESVAVGSEKFAARVKIELGFKAQHRQVAMAHEMYTLRETEQAYGWRNEALRPNNAVPWLVARCVAMSGAPSYSPAGR